jgi:hypothetical protein
MGRKEDVPNRRYTLEYKIEVVRLAESIGGSQAANDQVNTCLCPTFVPNLVHALDFECLEEGGCVKWCTSNRGGVTSVASFDSFMSMTIP